jgi:Predicted transcriptional regulator
MKVQNRLEELLARKQRIEGRKITKQVLSEETGLSISSLYQWSRNETTRFDSNHIVILCQYFGCGLHDLLVVVEEDSEEEGVPELLIAV